MLMNEELKTYVKWERSTDVVQRGRDPVGIAKRFEQTMLEDHRMPVYATPIGESPADGSTGHYGLMFGGLYISTAKDGLHLVQPREYLGVVCHKSSNYGTTRNARQAAQELGLPYKGKTR